MKYTYRTQLSALSLLLFAALTCACTSIDGATESESGVARSKLSIASASTKTCTNSCSWPAFNGVAVSCSTTTYCLGHDSGVFCDGGATVLCSTCGNGTCDGSESNATCPNDCPICGDGICSAGEDPYNCPSDCQTICGNGICEQDEYSTCPYDCCGGGGYLCY